MFTINRTVIRSFFVSVIILIISFPLFFTIIVNLSSDYDLKVYMPTGEELTEKNAINFSRKAMFESGIDASRASPIPYRHTESSGDFGDNIFFARNQFSSNTGYVIWDNKYTVYIRRIDKDYVFFRVVKSK